MAIDVQINNSFTPFGTGSPISGSRVISGSALNMINQVMASGLTDSLIPMTFTAANLKAFIAQADVNMTIETNSGASPGNTINLKAGAMFRWIADEAYFSNPFTVNVTAFYITTTLSGRLRIAVFT